MNRYAIYHTPNVPYAYAKNNDTLTVRLRAGKGDLSCCRVYYKCRYDWDSQFNVKDMKLMAQDELFDYYESDLQIEKNRYRYYFELIDMEGNKLYFDERGVSEQELARERELERKEDTAFQYAYIGKADVYDESKWLQESIVYQIFPDRFYNGDKSNDPENTKAWGCEVDRSSMFGGDIKGIIEKLDYLKDLGINLIYLTPVFKSTSNHKYNTTDYFDIDPQFGTIETAKELTAECHKRGIRVLFDAVFNHSGSDFFAFKDLLKNQEKSQYKDWYFPYEYPVSTDKINYYTFANDVASMPKLNTSNPEVKEYLLKVGEYWIKEVGIDGWRLDVADEVDHHFWKAFRERIKKANKDAIIVGEIHHESSSFLSGDEMDSIMNYPFEGAVIDFFAKKTIDAVEFNDILTQNITIYMDSIVRQMWNLVGSHDTKRFLTECDGDIKRMKLAVAFQFTYIGVPYIYYGDEVGMTGGNDPECRGCMIWDEEKQNKDMPKFYKKMVSIRKENKVLVYGSYRNLYLKGNVIVFERYNQSESVMVAINNSDKEAEINIGCTGEAVDLMSDEKIVLGGSLKLAPMKFKIIKRHTLNK